jgi:hypothetical protein
MSEFKKAIANSELDEGSILAIRIDGERIALYKNCRRSLCHQRDVLAQRLLTRRFRQDSRKRSSGMYLSRRKVSHQDRRSDEIARRVSTENLFDKDR